MKRLVLAFVLVLAVAATARSAFATADLPTLGTKMTTQCWFYPSDSAGRHGITKCYRRIVTISGGSCYVYEGPPARLYFEDDLFSTRWYKDNAVRWRLNGVAVEGDYSDVVRPNATLIYDSGDHGYSFGFYVPDDSCAAHPG